MKFIRFLSGKVRILFQLGGPIISMVTLSCMCWQVFGEKDIENQMLWKLQCHSSRLMRVFNIKTQQDKFH